MQNKVLNVFFGQDLLPYKDAERTIHYPVGGNAFAGSNLTNEIHFFVDQIGGTTGITWVLVSKLPNGKLGYEVINSVNSDINYNESYLNFSLSSYYTQYQGVVKLALRGYKGEITFTPTDNDDIYEISGNPLIEVTGTIDLAINYSPFANTGAQLLPTDIDRILASLSNYALITDTIIVVSNVSSVDYNDYSVGQLFYNKADKSYYVNTGSAITLYHKYLSLFELDENTKLSTIVTLGGAAIVTTNSGANKYIVTCYVSGSSGGNPYYDYSIICISGSGYPTTLTYKLDEAVADTLIQTLISASGWKSIATEDYVSSNFVAKTNNANKVYGTDYQGAQTTYSVDSFYEGNIARRDTDNSITVPLTPTQNGHAASKKYVDDKVKEFAENELQVVSELPLTGEEGIIYLLPVSENPSDGYYRYIWENNAWLNLGTTEIDLSDYYTKAETNGLLATKQDELTTTSVVDGSVDKAIGFDSLGNLVKGPVGGIITVDDELSTSSTNPVQNKVITQNVLDLQYRVSLLEEAILSEDTLSYTYLSNALIPQASDNSYPIITKAGLDMIGIKGRSFVKNQLLKSRNGTTTVNGLDYVYSDDGSITITGTATAYSYLYLGQSANDTINYIANHKYLCLTNVSGTVTGSYRVAFIDLSSTTTGALITATSSGSGRSYISFDNGCVVNIVIKPVIFDLTLSCIDSATTVDEAVALLQQNGINPYEYNVYNAGTIIDSKPVALISHGFNIWDEEYLNGFYDGSNGLYNYATNQLCSKNYIKIIGGKSYRCDLGDNTTYWRVCWYDKNKVFISSTPQLGGTSVQAPNSAAYAQFGFGSVYGDTYKNDVCFHLTVTRTGYAPYKAPITYQLSTPILRSAKTIQDTNKKVNIGTVDLGTLEWGGYNATYGAFYTAEMQDLIEHSTQNVINNGNFTLENSLWFFNRESTVQKAIHVYSNGNIYIRDNVNFVNKTPEQVKALLSGVMLNYELATPNDQPTITIPEDIEIELGGSLEIQYDNGSTTPCDFVFDTAVYKPIQ